MRNLVASFMCILSSLSVLVIILCLFVTALEPRGEETTQNYKEEQPQCTSNKVQLSTGHKENEVQEYCYPEITTDIGKLK